MRLVRELLDGYEWEVMARLQRPFTHPGEYDIGWKKWPGFLAEQRERIRALLLPNGGDQ